MEKAISVPASDLRPRIPQHFFKVRFPPCRIFSFKLTSAVIMRGSAYLLLCLYLILKVDSGETASSNLGITHRNRTKESHKNSEPAKKGREGSTTRTDAKNPTKSVMFRDERLCFVVRRIYLNLPPQNPAADKEYFIDTVDEPDATVNGTDDGFIDYEDPNYEAIYHHEDDTSYPDVAPPNPRVPPPPDHRFPPFSRVPAVPQYLPLNEAQSLSRAVPQYLPLNQVQSLLMSPPVPQYLPLDRVPPMPQFPQYLTIPRFPQDRGVPAMAQFPRKASRYPPITKFEQMSGTPPMPQFLPPVNRQRLGERSKEIEQRLIMVGYQLPLHRLC